MSRGMGWVQMAACGASGRTRKAATWPTTYDIAAMSYPIKPDADGVTWISDARRVAVKRRARRLAAPRDWLWVSDRAARGPGLRPDRDGRTNLPPLDDHQEAGGKWIAHDQREHATRKRQHFNQTSQPRRQEAEAVGMSLSPTKQRGCDENISSRLCPHLQPSVSHRLSV